jgi:hypothetical protein
MLVLPSVSAAFGPASLLRLVGLLGLTWLLLWLAVGQEIPHRFVLRGLGASLLACLPMGMRGWSKVPVDATGGWVVEL